MTYAFSDDHLPKTSSTIPDRAEARQSGLSRVFSNWMYRQLQLQELRQLMAMDNHMLSDIGVSRHEALHEYLRLRTGRRS